MTFKPMITNELQMKVEPIISEQLSHQMCLSNHNVHIFDSPNMTFDFWIKSCSAMQYVLTSIHTVFCFTYIELQILYTCMPDILIWVTIILVNKSTCVYFIRILPNQQTCLVLYTNLSIIVMCHIVICNFNFHSSFLYSIYSLYAFFMSNIIYGTGTYLGLSRLIFKYLVTDCYLYDRNIEFHKSHKYLRTALMKWEKSID